MDKRNVNDITRIGVNTRIFFEKYSGIQNYIKNLYISILKLDDTTKYYFFQIDNLKEIGLTKVCNLFKNSFGSFIFDTFAVNKLISRENIHIFHAPSHILPFFKKKGVKYILTIHDLSFLLFPNYYSTIFRLYYRYFVKRSLFHADVVIAVSNSTKRDIIKYYNINESKIRVIYSGINEIFLRKTINKRLIDDDYFFSVTTHPIRKNIISILRIIAKNKLLSNYKYVIAGLISRKQITELNKIILELNISNTVIIWGYATNDELVNLYQNAKFFIYPSFYEGFGFPVLEAMAGGCPVITSNCSSLIEIMPNDEWLINPHDLFDIENKMEKIIALSERERNTLIENNYNYSKQFSWNTTAEKVLKIFSELVKDNC